MRVVDDESKAQVFLTNMDERLPSKVFWSAVLHGAFLVDSKLLFDGQIHKYKALTVTPRIIYISAKVQAQSPIFCVHIKKHTTAKWVVMHDPREFARLRQQHAKNKARVWSLVTTEEQLRMAASSQDWMKHHNYTIHQFKEMVQRN